METITTEQKIIRAADKLFTQKGYAATKTREIAEEAGTNLALLNYYFGSKENLFKKVVQEKFSILLGALGPVLSDEQISLKDKISLITENYTNLLLENEELPIFILNELTVNKELFAKIIQNTRLIAQPVLEKQLKETGAEISATDLIINTLSMSMFPFIAKPLITSSGLVKEDEFVGFVTGRKEKIQQWITIIIEQSENCKKTEACS
ncbi:MULTISPECIES: TetR/AcrR family transcriptional regulator [unclassified Proteiniphilum]|jgi:AcrR family transcriptional regulator|uniref:TetR/AcrR family transcriptional regulator n=1 Tax=unclassified Proteiniphilum TaxID=2622718 RepID=UPI000E8A72CE|nr:MULTISPECIES: TetR family transcriptional regulator [unclassified Proteiniphilum]HBG58494.1 TetR family transcriptional regulator [Porphyromonadaceae bacterium]